MLFKGHLRILELSTKFSIMKFVTARKSILSSTFFLIIPLISFSSVQKLDSVSGKQIKKLSTFCKIWGFLKYYHPYPSSKDVDWDKTLVDNYQKVKESKSKAEFNNLINDIIILSTGKLKEYDKVFYQEDSAGLNIDFNWILDTSLINGTTSSYLLSIKNNHRPFRNKFVKGASYVGNPIFNENAYPDMFFPKESFRFLALARYWNVIEYFYPNKYLMDIKWDTSLVSAIPIFMCSTNLNDYYRAIQWISARINDSHASIVYNPELKMNTRVPPIWVFYLDDTLIVTSFINDSIENTVSVKIGDKIFSINGSTVKEKWADEQIHHSASNVEWSEKVNTGMSGLLRSENDSTTLMVLRDRQVLQIKVKNYSWNEILMLIIKASHSKTKPSAVYTDTISGKKYGYLNLGEIESSSVDSFFCSMNGVDYLIIDVRESSSDVMTWGKVANKIVRGKKYVAKISYPDYAHPGYLKFRQSSLAVGTNKQDYYQGNVIILIDHGVMSHGEYATMALSMAPKAILIGTRTAGADGNVSEVVLPGNYHCEFTGLGWYYLNGKQTQRIGIIPNINVDYSLDSELKQGDPIMQRALEFIRNGQ